MAQINIIEDAEAATQDVQDLRQSICNTCDQYDPQLDMCSACGCLVARKKYYVDDTCPEGKWS